MRGGATPLPRARNPKYKHVACVSWAIQWRVMKRYTNRQIDEWMDIQACSALTRQYQSLLPYTPGNGSQGGNISQVVIDCFKNLSHNLPLLSKYQENASWKEFLGKGTGLISNQLRSKETAVSYCQCLSPYGTVIQTCSFSSKLYTLFWMIQHLPRPFHTICVSVISRHQPLKVNILLSQLFILIVKWSVFGRQPVLSSLSKAKLTWWQVAF